MTAGQPLFSAKVEQSRDNKHTSLTNPLPFATVSTMENFRIIPRELIRPFLIRAKLASFFGLIPLSVNVKTGKIQRGNIFTRIASYHYLFWVSIRITFMTDQVLQFWYSEGEESANFSASTSTLSFWIVATAAHIEMCHIKVNDLIILFNSLEFRPAGTRMRGKFKWRNWVEYFKTVAKEFKKLGFTGVVLFTEPIGAYIYMASQIRSSLFNPGTSNTQLYSYLPDRWKTSSSVLFCAIFDAAINFFMIANISLMVVIALAVRIAYLEPMEQFLKG